ncbi:MAG: AbrB family transcriptional regulator [Proteobacteria bacterium]|nr:AbrB family transcriptional regulator [Pseudomonadota bacterium]
MALALALGAAGGALFWRLDLPLAWMLGAMCLTTLAAVGRVPLGMSQGLRSVMVAVLGVMLGSAFTPDLLSQAGAWAVSLAALVPYLLVATLLSLLYFRRVARYDMATAFYAGVPGGLAQMIVLGTEQGGDTRAISLAHAARILLVVSTIPFWFRLTGDAGASSAAATLAGRPHLLDVGLADLGLLAAAAVVGSLVAVRLRLPAATLIGPMIVSAAIHLTGLTASTPPLEAVAVAQVVLGTAIGCRFAGTRAVTLLHALLLAVGALVLLLAVAVFFALVVGWATGLDFDALLLAYAPGGLAEMSLIALAQDIDPAFVAAHHTLRIALVVLLAPLLFRVMARTGRTQGD